MMKEYATKSAEETFLLGKELGRSASAGAVFALCGDLGAGKTVFTQGFAEGLGIRERVTSPTFTILQVYEEGRLPLYHFDVYRIAEAEEMDEIGYEEYVYGEGVSLVEWANLFPELFPEKTIWIDIRRDIAEGPDYRRITIRSGSGD